MIRIRALVLTLGLGPAVAFGLAACGVKGPVEPPRAAAVEPAPAASAPATASAAPAGPVAPPIPGAPPTITAQPAAAPSTAVVNAPASTQRSALDWLID